MTTTPSPSFALRRRIGNTNYEASVFFSPAATQTFEQKIMRMIQNESVDFSEKCGIISLPQTSPQSERSAV